MRVFDIFGPPETLHSDQGREFENKVISQLQEVFGYKKTRPLRIVRKTTLCLRITLHVACHAGDVQQQSTG